MQKEDKSYDQMVSFQKDNHETKGPVENQNEHHNARKEALGPNTRRDK